MSSKVIKLNTWLNKSRTTHRSQHATSVAKATLISQTKRLTLSLPAKVWHYTSSIELTSISISLKNSMNYSLQFSVRII